MSIIRLIGISICFAFVCFALKKRESNRALGGYGLHTYITDRLMYKKDKDAFLSVSDLMEDFKEYAENNQEEKLLNRFAEKGNNTKLGAIIRRELAALIKNCYERSTGYGRYTKLKNGVYGSGVRPYGLKNLCIRSVDNQVSDGFEALTPKVVTNEEDINDLLMCFTTVIPLKSLNDPQFAQSIKSNIPSPSFSDRFSTGVNFSITSAGFVYSGVKLTQAAQTERRNTRLEVASHFTDEKRNYPFVLCRCSNF